MMEQSWRRLATAQMALVLLGSLRCTGLAAAETTPLVEFDIPYAVACRDATTSEFREKNPEHKLIEAQFEVSTLLREGKEDDLQQITVSLSSPRQRLRVEDFAPRTELHCDVKGEIKVVEKSEDIKTSDASLGGAISGDIGPVKAKISPALGGVKTQKNATEENFTKLPPKQVLVAAGTTNRGHGVVFKLKPSTQASLQGQKQYRCTFVVPKGWRADYLLVECRAEAQPRRPFYERAECGERQVCVGLYIEGDSEAHQAAQEVGESFESYIDIVQQRQQASDCDLPGLLKHVPGGMFLCSLADSDHRRRQKQTTEAEKQVRSATENIVRFAN